MNVTIEHNSHDVKIYGDARRLLLQTMTQLRDGDIPVATGLAIAAEMKALNNKVRREINAKKTVAYCRKKLFELIGLRFSQKHGNNWQQSAGFFCYDFY